jgi:hypothetical protein
MHSQILKSHPGYSKTRGIYTPLATLHGSQIALWQLEYPMDIPVPRVFYSLDCTSCQIYTNHASLVALKIPSILPSRALHALIFTREL